MKFDEEQIKFGKIERAYLGNRAYTISQYRTPPLSQHNSIIVLQNPQVNTLNVHPSTRNYNIDHNMVSQAIQEINDLIIAEDYKGDVKSYKRHSVCAIFAFFTLVGLIIYICYFHNLLQNYIERQKSICEKVRELLRKKNDEWRNHGFVILVTDAFPEWIEIQIISPDPLKMASPKHVVQNYQPIYQSSNPMIENTIHIQPRAASHCVSSSSQPHGHCPV